MDELKIAARFGIQSELYFKITPKQFYETVESYYEKAKLDSIVPLMLVNMVGGFLGGKKYKVISPDNLYGGKEKKKLSFEEKIENKFREDVRDYKENLAKKKVVK